MGFRRYQTLLLVLDCRKEIGVDRYAFHHFCRDAESIFLEKIGKPITINQINSDGPVSCRFIICLR